MKGLDTLPEASGIYIIRHDASGREYVGQAVNVRARAQQHVSDLSRGKRRGLFQSCWNKHGPDAFSIRVAELVEPVKELLDRAEQQYLDTDGFAFNTCRVAGSMLGWSWSKASPEARARKSAQVKIALSTPEHRARVSAQSKARWEDPEARARLSAQAKIALSTPEARARLSAQAKIALSTPEHRARLSAQSKAHWENPEARAQQSARSKAHWENPEYRARVSEQAKIAKSTPEHRARLSAQAKARWEDPEHRAQSKARIIALWAEVRALGLRSLAELKAHKATANRKQSVKVKEQIMNDG